MMCVAAALISSRWSFEPAVGKNSLILDPGPVQYPGYHK